MRYWRHYPRFLQVILLMLMVFTLASFSTVIAGVSVKPLFGVSLQDVATLTPASTDPVVHAAQLIRGLSSLFTFAISALLFAYLTHPNPLPYLGIRKPGLTVQWWLILLLFLFFIPLANQLSTWLQQIDLGAGSRLRDEQNEIMTRILMRGTAPGDLVLHILLFALLPAIGEEFLFRGVIMRFAYHSTRNIHFAILFSAALFALAHGSAYHFLPIMMMGAVLGYIYYLSSSIWPGVAAHFMNNALAATGLYLQNKKVVPGEIGSGDSFPWYVLVVCLMGFVTVFYFLRRQATPLPANWSDDFAAPGTH